MNIKRVLSVILTIGALLLTTGGLAQAGAHETPPLANTLASPLGVQFAHIATTYNTVSHATYLDHYATNNRPDALLFVTPDVQPGGVGDYIYDPHPIGVSYDNVYGYWTIYNQDYAAMPQYATFHVLVAAAGPSAFIHTATAGNIAGDATYIDSPLTNDNPNAMILVTPNLHTIGVNNPHLIGAWYQNSTGRWGIFNLDASAMPVGADFNVLVLPTDRPAFVHRSTAANVAGAVTYLDHPALNGHPHAIPFIFHNTSPGGGAYAVDNHPVGVWYSTTRGRWAVTQLDVTTMPVDVAFNVLVPSVDSAAFTHYATGLNIYTDYTYFRHPLTDNLPHTILFATANWNPGGIGGLYHNHPIGVKFAPYDAKWSVFNEDGVYMPTDPAFNVLIPVPDAGVFVHKATVSALSTYLSHPLTNGRPDAILIVTPNWNPGGGVGVYNNHVIGVQYITAAQQWIIINQDSVDMPAGAAFNVLVAPSGPAFGSTAFVHTATADNIVGHITYIDHPATNNRPGALLFVTFRCIGPNNPHVTGVYYSARMQKWSIFNQDGAPMPDGAAFNVLVFNKQVFLPLVLREH